MPISARASSPTKSNSVADLANHYLNAQPANGHREQFKLIRAFNQANPSPKLNQTQAGRQAGRQAVR